MAADRAGSVAGLVGRLGGPVRLRAILDDLYARLAADPLIGFFFAGKDLSMLAAGQHAFLMRAFQETERFHGRHPGVAHLELAPIRRGQFDRRLFVLREVLTEQGVHPLDVDAWAKVEEGMRGLIQR